MLKILWLIFKVWESMALEILLFFHCMIYSLGSLLICCIFTSTLQTVIADLFHLSSFYDRYQTFASEQLYPARFFPGELWVQMPPFNPYFIFLSFLVGSIRIFADKSFSRACGPFMDIKGIHCIILKTHLYCFIIHILLII